jgi:hypothetical protein
MSAGAVAALLLVAGCGGDSRGTTGAAGRGPDRSSATPTTSAPSSEAADPTASGRATAAGETSSRVDPAAPGFPPRRSPTVVRRREFTSPTGNITCQMDRRYAVCIIGERDYPVTPRAADCTQDRAPLFSVRTGGKATFGSCEGGVVGPGSSLPYGTTSVVGPMACLSRQSGMLCWSSRTGHGFRVARASYDLH